MSPEQARGEDDLDHRVDVWALGVMLYECLTGEVPFHANNYLGIISQVLTRDAPPPSRLRPELGIPPAVETVVMRAMEKDRQKRYQTMADLEQDLERLLAGDQNVGSPRGRGQYDAARAAGGRAGRAAALAAGDRRRGGDGGGDRDRAAPPERRALGGDEAAVQTRRPRGAAPCRHRLPPAAPPPPPAAEARAVAARLRRRRPARRASRPRTASPVHGDHKAGATRSRRCRRGSNLRSR